MRKNNKSPKKLAGRALVEKKPPTSRKENVSLDTERDRLRKRTKKRTAASVVGIIIIVIIVGGSLVMVGKNIVELALEPESQITTEQTSLQPNAPIYDENGTGEISARTKEYIGLLESDLKDLGYTMSRAALPIGKMREVDINLEGVAPYFKVNIERGTAVSAEDIVRMVKYLGENNLLESTTYVDVRIAGKAYYK